MATVGASVAALGAAPAGAGAGALGAAVAAPGTSARAGRPAPQRRRPHSPGIGAAIALLLVTAALSLWIGRRAGVRLLEPVTRPAGEDVPAHVHV